MRKSREKMWKSVFKELLKEPCAICDKVHWSCYLKYDDEMWDDGICEDCYERYYREDIEFEEATGCSFCGDYHDGIDQIRKSHIEGEI